MRDKNEKHKNSKEDVNMSSAESSGSSDEDEDETEYVVEKVVGKRIQKGKVSFSDNLFASNFDIPLDSWNRHSHFAIK